MKPTKLGISIGESVDIPPSLMSVDDDIPDKHAVCSSNLLNETTGIFKTINDSVDSVALCKTSVKCDHDRVKDLREPNQVVCSKIDNDESKTNKNREIFKHNKTVPRRSDFRGSRNFNYRNRGTRGYRAQYENRRFRDQNNYNNFNEPNNHRFNNRR